MKKTRLTLLIATTLTFSCTSKPILFEAQPTTGTATNNKNEALELIESSAREKRFNLFPQAVADKINNTSEPQQIQKLVCNGQTPKYVPAFKIKLILPKPTPGIPLDEAQEKIKTYIQSARAYLQKYFFMSAITDQSKLYFNNSRLQEYNNTIKRCFDLDSEDDCRLIDRVKLNIPFVENSDINKLESELSSQVSNLDILRELRWGEHTVDRLFNGIVNAKSSTIVLYPKSYSVFSVDWTNNDSNTPQTTYQRIKDDLSDSNYFWKVNFWMANEKTWKTPETTITPLQIASLKDLNVLVKNYAFILPRETICKIENPEQCENNNNTVSDIHYWGYDGTKFSAKYAIEHQHFIWSRVIEHQTSIVEAPQENGNVYFTVKVDLDLFCKYAFPIHELNTTSEDNSHN